MDSGFINILKQLVAEQGNAALTDAKTCKAFLKDYAKGEYKKEIRLILQAVEDGMARVIDGADELEPCKKALIRDLEEDHDLKSETAAGIVNALALVLRGDKTVTVSATVQQTAAPVTAFSDSAANSGVATEAFPQTERSFMEMVPIPAGTFMMGSPASEPNRRDDETKHSVTLSAFRMGKYQVTQGQYEAVMGTNPSHFTTGATAGESQNRRPVENVRWYDALVFCNKLSIKEGLSPAYRIDGSTDPAAWGAVPTSTTHANYATWDAAQIVPGATGYRLPTEAQWEYACRAGTTTAYNTGANITNDTGWYSSNSGDETHEVGKKPANAWGLYDMHGNVLEWCWDWYGAYPSGAQSDPAGPVSGCNRVWRGGSWLSYGQDLRSGWRGLIFPSLRGHNVGFRLVRPCTVEEATSASNAANSGVATAAFPQTERSFVEMVLIPGGKFMMGSPAGEPYRGSDETQHRVTLSAFRMGKYQVTQEQYQVMMRTNPSSFTTGVTAGENQNRHPVENVSWYDAVEFCNRLSKWEGLSPAYSINGSTVQVVSGSNGYRLPTEAQWEYACRAGTTTAYNTGASISDDTGWYSSNSGSKTHEVGQKPTNAWGLHDMHGNVLEWCWDWYGAYPSAAQADPSGPVSGSYRVSRGGSWYGSGQYLRSAWRYYSLPGYRLSYFGFRLVRP
ncbi:MAG: formylglycine-generating enzyme family protein [Treponema sp.]|jgi:formylglycine-generating enzyme required for sulfatase activity|nr:formylglycine-generating enzyme family protein [Treponema sp.]